MDMRNERFRPVIRTGTEITPIGVRPGQPVSKRARLGIAKKDVQPNPLDRRVLWRLPVVASEGEISRVVKLDLVKERQKLELG